MDGNNSLKRVLRRETHVAHYGPDGVATVGESIEQEDSRQVGGDYYLSRNQVDKWAKEMIQTMIPSGSSEANNDDDNPKRVDGPT